MSGAALRKGLCFAQGQVSLNIILSLFKLHKFLLFSDHLQLQVQSDGLTAILEASYYSTFALKDLKWKETGLPFNFGESNSQTKVS